MRYGASERLEIIHLVEQSHLGVRPTLEKLGIPKTTFYRWYDRYLTFGEVGLEDRNSNPGRVWNRIPQAFDQNRQVSTQPIDNKTLHAKIGELTLENDFLEGALTNQGSLNRPGTPVTGSIPICCALCA
jgi:transposase-like protein